MLTVEVGGDVVAAWGVVEWGPNPSADLLVTLLWFSVGVALLWIHTARWLTDGPLGRRIRDETSRTFALELPQGVAGSIGWVSVPVGAVLISVGVLDLAGVEPSLATTAASVAVAALLTFLTWHSGNKHRWVLPAEPGPACGGRTMSSSAEVAPAGWYADPRDSAVLRFWDGRSWTSSCVPRFPPPWPGEPKDLHGGSLDAFGAVRSGFRNAFVYRGRASRSAFWWFQLAVGLTWFVLAALSVWAVTASASPSDLSAHDQLSDWVLLGTTLLALVVYAVPTIALTVRRLHDINKPGWWALINLIPGGSVALLVLLILPGTPGPNGFDPPVGQPGATASLSGAATR